jgi:NADH-quinone oxidoreductase subunit J
MEQIIFYILAATAVIATLLAITEKHPVHAILFLVTSLFSMAVLFYLLMAPLVAAFEVILYAGAIMVLFLFVIMMLDLGHPEKGLSPHWREWLPALLLSGLSIVSLAVVIVSRHAAPASTVVMPSIREVAVRLFREHGLAVELISLQLLFALVGALYLGRQGINSLPPFQGEGRGGDGVGSSPAHNIETHPHPNPPPEGEGIATGNVQP